MTERTGRELDAYLHQAIFAGKVDWDCDIPFVKGTSKVVPHYSTNDATALQLAEELRQKGQDVQLYLRPDAPGILCYGCIVLSSSNKFGSGGLRWADTLALAICLAAEEVAEAMEKKRA